ncbi:hypothetical protein GCM10023317_44500 [Actinopolymorpha pittospori]
MPSGFQEECLPAYHLHVRRSEPDFAAYTPCHASSEPQSAGRHRTDPGAAWRPQPNRYHCGQVASEDADLSERVPEGADVRMNTSTATADTSATGSLVDHLYAAP